MSSKSESEETKFNGDTATDISGEKIPFPTCLPMNISNFQNNPEERIWRGGFTFIHAADPQFGLVEKYFLHKENPRWDVEIKLAEKAIAMANSMDPKPRFFVVCGDMLDMRPGTQEEQQLRTEQYVDFVKVFKGLDPEIKLVCTCGNHDVCDVPTPETIDIYRREFGPEFFSFWVGGVKFVVLNSQYFKSPDTVPIYFKQHEEFLQTIPDPSAKHIVAMQHIPFFISDPDEEEVIYLNIEKNFRFPVMDQLIESGVRHIFCGHYHRNAGGAYKSLEQVVTSALGGPLGSDPSGFRIVHVLENKIIHEYVSVEENGDNPKPLTSLSDSNLGNAPEQNQSCEEAVVAEQNLDGENDTVNIQRE